MIVSSKRVLDPSSGIFRPATLRFSEAGTISSLSWNTLEGKTYPGALIPGFVNAHCHLELSHLKGKVKEKTGMAGFIADLVPNRNGATEQDRIVAMQNADAAMFRNGISVVGDISNSSESISVKRNSFIAYHTFVEVFDLHPSKTEEVYSKGLELLKLFEGLPASMVPHAPYTVTPGLFDKINKLYQEKNTPVCIHNQESAAESDFFSHRGSLWELFSKMNLDLSWVPLTKDSLSYTFNYFPAQNLQLVHNTYLQSTSALRSHHELCPVTPFAFLCTCPNANIYIENQLPDLLAWHRAGLKVTVGTDSLASNHSLSILDELKTITNRCSEIPLSALLTWATANGADFLGFSGMYGRLQEGKKPGLLHLENFDKAGNLCEETTVKRLI